jgi:hypothetical protein
VLYSFGIRSKYNIFFGDNELSIDNGGGYYKSIDLRIGKVLLAPNIKSGVLKNGLSGETPSSYTLFSNPTTWEAYFLDNRILGTHSLIASWEEFGASFGTAERIATQSFQNFRVGASIAVGDAGYKAIELNLSTHF